MVDIELPTQAKQGGSISLLQINTTFTTENAAPITYATSQPTISAAWS